MTKSVDLSQLAELRQKFPFLNQELLAGGRLLSFEKNEPLVRQGEPLKHLYLLLSGKARIVKNEANGKRLILQFLETGDLIGELTLVDAEEETKDVIAMGTVTCLALPLPLVREYYKSEGHLARYLARYIGEKLLKRMEHFSNAQTFELKYRLAALLLEVAVQGRYEENNGQIADYLGVSYRHLMHTLKWLREQGYIEKCPRGYQLKVERLQTLVKEGATR